MDPPGSSASAAARASGGYRAAPAPVSMAAYNDCRGVCIDGASPVRLASGKEVRADELRKGDRVAASGGAEAEVACIVRTRCQDGIAELVELPGGARLTPYHPVHIAGQ